MFIGIQCHLLVNLLFLLGTIISHRIMLPAEDKVITDAIMFDIITFPAATQFDSTEIIIDVCAKCLYRYNSCKSGSVCFLALLFLLVKKIEKKKKGGGGISQDILCLLDIFE